jgi:hypothetical protein
MSKITSKFLVCAVAHSDGSPPWGRVISAEIVKGDGLEAAKIRVLRDRNLCEVFDLSDAKHIASLLIAGRVLVEAEPTVALVEDDAEPAETAWDHIAKMSAQGHSSGGFVASAEGMVGK